MGYTPPMIAWWSLFKSAFGEWNKDKAPRLAAALAFSTIFSIAPLLIIVIAIVGQVLGFTGGPHPHTQAENALLGPIRAAAGNAAAATVHGMIDASFGKPRQGIIAQIIGWIMFVVGAIGVFAALQDSLNTVWDVEPKKKSLWTNVRERLTSVAMLLVIGLLLLVTFIANAAISFVATYVQGALPFPGAGIVFAIVNWVVSIAIITGLFALMYKYLPDAEVEWRDVRAGAAITAVLFVIGQALIGFYLGRAGVASAYGAAGSLLALLLWIYYSSMLLLFGAEFTKVYAQTHGSRIEGRGAVPAATPLPA